MLRAAKKRFESKFVKADGCWEWNAGCWKNGYGAFGLDGKTQRAHRVSYQLYLGEIPEGLQVLHKCDNRACVNPEHLFLGTHADNMKDCAKKGRYGSPSGEKHYKSKLTDEQVADIRARQKAGVKGTDLAREFGLTPSGISRIVLNKTRVK